MKQHLKLFNFILLSDMLLLKGRKMIFKQPTRARAAYIHFTMHDTFNSLVIGLFLCRDSRKHVFRDRMNRSYLSISLTLALSSPWVF